MTSELVIVETGEVVEEMTAEQASSITTQIAVKLDAMADNFESVRPLIRDALTRKAHVALGYKSEGAYVADRFGGALSRLGVDMRRVLVAELTDAGMSTRQIAPVFDISHKTVVKDRQARAQAQVVLEVPPEEPRLPQKRLADLTVDDFMPPRRQAPADADRPQRSVRITGTDGKSYPAQPKGAPKQPRRGDLTRDSLRLGQDIRKLTNRIQKLAQDDRLSRNKEQVAADLRNYLSDAVEVCQDLLDRLTN